MYRPVVFVAVGGCGMDKPTVRPRLTWSGSEPAVAHRKLLGQSADYRHLFRRKIVHHTLRIKSLSRIGRLVDVVFDKPIHGRNGSLRWPRAASKFGNEVPRQRFVRCSRTSCSSRAGGPTPLAHSPSRPSTDIEISPKQPSRAAPPPVSLMRMLWRRLRFLKNEALMSLACGVSRSSGRHTGTHHAPSRRHDE